MSVTIAAVTAAGVSQPDAARFSADSIEATGLESVSIGGPTGGRVTYKTPQIIMKDYSGPASMPTRLASASIVEAYRSVLEQFAAVSATSVTAPTIVGTINNFGTITSADFTYSGIALRDIKNGKIAFTQIERLDFTANTLQVGKADKMSGEIVNFASRDFDAAAVAAILDPQKANDDKYYGVYGQTTAGPYTITSAQGLRMRIDGMTIDDVSVRPSRLQLPALLALMPAAGRHAQAQAREMIDKMANIYRGHARSAQPRCAASRRTRRRARFKLAAVRFNLENGKVGEFAVEGLDGRSPKGPIKVGRFALKSLDIAGLLRMAAQFSNPAATAVTRPGARDVSAARGRRSQRRRSAVQEHRQAAQRRPRQPGLGPVHRANPEQGAADCEDVRSARRDPSRADEYLSPPAWTRWRSISISARHGPRRRAHSYWSPARSKSATS